MKGSGPPREKGFALPLLLVAIAMLSLSAFGADDAIRQSRLVFERADREAEAERYVATATARLAYLVLTEPMSQRGLRVGGDRIGAGGLVGPVDRETRSARGQRIEELVFDGRGYTLEAPGYGRFAVVVRVQDEAGLLNLNGQDEQAVQAVLESLGVSRVDAQSLAASLADYTDGDDVRRREGAERRDYGRAGLPGPLNEPLRTPRGTFAVLGWREALSPLQARTFIDVSTSLNASQPLNLNTAPPNVLQAVLGLPARLAVRLADAREHQSFRSLTDVTEVTGAPLAGGQTPVGALPSRHLRVKIELIDQRAPQRRFGVEQALVIGREQALRPIQASFISSILPIARANDGEQRRFPSLR